MSSGDQKPDVDKLIDESLRKVYDTVLNEGVPDRLTDLLKQLREADDTAGSDGTSSGEEE